MISIILPTYEMSGNGTMFLSKCLYKILQQDYQNYEVIISDNSKDREIESLVENFHESRFKYFKSRHYGSAANTNYGMSLASGDIIKPMFQDDYFFSTTCLSELANTEGKWFAYSRVQDVGGMLSPVIKPFWNPNIIRGYNTISTPSCIAFQLEYDVVPYRGLRQFFDDKLNWFMDVDFYYRLYKLYGEPTILKSIVGVCEWKGRVTESINHDIVIEEEEYINRKYNGNSL